LLDIHATDGTAIASLGLTSTAGIGGNYRGINFVGLGVHSAGKSAFVRLTLSWSANTYALYVDGLLVSSGSGTGLNIGQMAVGHSLPGITGIKNYHIRNLVFSSQPVVFPVQFRIDGRVPAIAGHEQCGHVHRANRRQRLSWRNPEH
jgi:hypothetical protein